MDDAYFNAIKLLAIKAVEKPTVESYLRHIRRWYSKTFHTPLSDVDDLDTDYILQAYFEETYEDMSKEERQQEISNLLQTEEEVKQEKLATDFDMAERFELMQIAKEQERDRAAAQEKKRLADLKDPNRAFKKVPETKIPEAKMSNPFAEVKNLPPDIEIKFIDPETFEEELENGGIGAFRKKGNL